jgi:hypothetical protein
VILIRQNTLWELVSTAKQSGGFNITQKLIFSDKFHSLLNNTKFGSYRVYMFLTAPKIDSVYEKEFYIVRIVIKKFDWQEWRATLIGASKLFPSVVLQI